MNYLWYKGKYSGKSTDYLLDWDWDLVNTWMAWMENLHDFSNRKVHWETDCSAECHLPCINSPHKEHLHTSGTTLAALPRQKQVICAKKIFQKVQKQQSYNLFIYITLLEFPVFSLAKISERSRCNWVTGRGTSAAHCVHDNVFYLHIYFEYCCVFDPVLPSTSVNQVDN